MGPFFLLSEDKSEIDLLSVRGPLHSSRVGDWNEGWQNWYLHMYHTHNHAMSTIPTPLLILIIMRKLQRHLSPPGQQNLADFLRSSLAVALERKREERNREK